METTFNVSLNDLRAVLQNRKEKVSPLASLAPLSCVPAGQDVTGLGKRAADQLLPEFSQAIEVISCADRLNKITLMQPDGSLKYYLLYSDAGQKSQGLLVEENGQALLCDESHWLESLLTFFPESASTSVKAFSQTLSPADALVLCTLMDAQSGKETPGTSPHEMAAILAGLPQAQSEEAGQDVLKNPLAKLLMGLLACEPPNAQQVVESLTRLGKTGLALQTQGGWIANSQATAFRWTGTSRAAYISKFALIDGIPASAELLLVSGNGWLAFIYAPQSEDQVEVSAYSSLSVKAFLNDFFSHRMEIPRTISSQPAAERGQQKKVTANKFTGKFWLMILLSLLSLCVACSGCGLALWALTW
jgi:hypothetical protein